MVLELNAISLFTFITIDAWELYDLDVDPNELDNLYEYSDYTSVIDELKIELTRFRNQNHEEDI